MEQYNRGLYKAAEQSFLRASDYQDYLLPADKEMLAKYLEMTREASAGQKEVLSDIQMAQDLINKGELAQAKAQLETLRENPYLTDEERQMVEAGLASIDEKMTEQQQEGLMSIYARSVNLYQMGDLESARSGFLTLSKNPEFKTPAGKLSPQDYLIKIDTALTKQEMTTVVPEPSLEETKEFQPPVEMQPEEEMEPTEILEPPATQKPAETPEPVTTLEPISEPAPQPLKDAEETLESQQLSYVQQVQRKRSVLQGYTSAILMDAVAKAEQALAQNEFEQAKYEVERADRVVETYRQEIGQTLYEQYNSKLETLMSRINSAQLAQEQRISQIQQQEAIENQEKYRERMEAERARRVKELMANAIAYQKQQRYEEALGQLESLLSLEPLNDRALTLKQTLEDTVSFRQQLQIRKTMSEQTTEILTRTDETQIPYADEVTYPRNWREISASPYRKPDEPIGQDPANREVYQQLEQKVDLTELTPETTFNDAIDILRYSVRPPLKINVNWNDLYDSGDIDQTTPTRMTGMRDVTLSTALELLLQQVSGGYVDIGYVVSDGIIKIGTAASLPDRLIPRVYDVSQLVDPSAGFFLPIGYMGGGMMGGMGGGDIGETYRMLYELRMLIIESVDYQSWDVYGGEATVRVYGMDKLIVTQTLENHKKIKLLFDDLMKALSQQVALECRFLIVSETFLEDIGVDVDFQYDPGKKWNIINFNQQSSDLVQPPGTTSAAIISGDYGAGLVSNLFVQFLIRATQQHEEGKVLNAPKVTVLNGRPAVISVNEARSYVGDYDFETITSAGFQQPLQTIADPVIGQVLDGVILDIVPTISKDKRYVSLRLVTWLSDSDLSNQFPVFSPQGDPFNIVLPEMEIATIRTRVNVPDGGTLLVGGQKLARETVTEAGVPVLSKIPILGRAFRNKSEVREQEILLILIRPMIILQEETEEQAIAKLEEAR